MVDQEWLAPGIIAGQRMDRGGIPSVQMHPDFAGTSCDYIAAKFDKAAISGHFEVHQVGGPQSEVLT